MFSALWLQIHSVFTILTLSVTKFSEQFAHQLGVNSFVDGVRNFQLQQTTEIKDASVYE